MIYCLTTVAEAIWACTGYATHALLIALQQHTSIYGAPDTIMSNKGSQMSFAAKDSIDWQAVMGGVTSKGVQWEIVPAQCQWRNRGAERTFQMAKHALKKKLEADATLDFQELQATSNGVSANSTRDH